MPKRPATRGSCVKPYPPKLGIEPASGPIRGVVRPPGSKSITNRALVIAALAEGDSRLIGALESDDTVVMRDSLARLGFTIQGAPPEAIRIRGGDGAMPAREADLYLGNSGTSIRFLTAMVALGNGTYRLDGNERMRQRPIGDLLAALQGLGVDATSESANGCPPVRVVARGLSSGDITVRGDVSSQYLSALLMVLPLADGRTTLRVDGPLVSKPYVAMTLAVMEAFGVKATRRDDGAFCFPGGQHYHSSDYAIEPDASAASYWFAAAALTGGSITVPDLGRHSLQGDTAFVRLLERMGCATEQTDSATTVHGTGQLQGIDADMADISDTAPTLAALACFAVGPTQIRGVRHMRVKETDRVAALANELRRAGIDVTEREDGLRIEPGIPRPTVFETYDDHRMAMSLALLGLREPGMVIANPGCVSKTYPAFFDELARFVQVTT